MLRIAIVVHRYGEEVAGGAEGQARGFAEEAARRGWAVEVWTTCVRDHYTWQNEYPPGSERHGGVLVRRFPVIQWEKDAHGELELALEWRGSLPAPDQFEWLDTGVHSPALYEHVARHASDHDVLVALPYSQGLVHYAAWIAPRRVVLWPCLHNEAYACLQPVHLLLETVWGVMFNSPEEGDLATRQLGIRPRRAAILGEGVTLNPPVVAPSGDRRDDLLFVGRLEDGKNLSLLYDYVRRYAGEGGNLRLVVAGPGPRRPPRHPAFDERGFVSEQEKADLYASALALCQPSLKESFSLTVMESWLTGRPVLVHGDCAVTRGHAERSSGGLWFRTYEEFVGAVEWLRDNPDLAARMGRNGQAYVRQNYTWEAVVSRFEHLVETWRQDGRESSR